MKGLELFGESVARAMGEQAPPAARARVRARVVSGLPERRPRLVGAWPVVAGVLLLAVVSFSWWTRAHRLEAVSATGPLAEGDWLTAPREAPLNVDFEDRGRVELGQGARARLSKVSRARVEVSLEEGKVALDVRPKSGTTWVIAAGPYRVEVLGTAFEARWSSEQQQLDVRVKRGVVRVMGATLAQHGVELRAGDSLQANVGSGQALLAHEPRPAPGAADTELRDDVEPPEPAVEGTSLPDAVPVPSSATAEGQGRTAESFRELARSAKYAEALALAEDLGFESLMNTLGAADLALLANAARYQKQSGKARLALLALRRRFPGSSEAGTATFLLGRLAAEQGQDYASAAKWFLTYSREYPKGPMAAEALGRRVQVLAISGESQGARDAAEQYLERYPSGAYATVARGVLDGHKLRSGR